MTNEEFNENVKKLTPENRIKLYDKYIELLEEQKNESSQDKK